MLAFAVNVMEDVKSSISVAYLFGGGEMADRHPQKILHINLDERKLSVLVHSLFSSWMLAFLFEGQIFYSLADSKKIDPAITVFC